MAASPRRTLQLPWVGHSSTKRAGSSLDERGWNRSRGAVAGAAATPRRATPAPHRPSSGTGTHTGGRHFEPGRCAREAAAPPGHRNPGSTRTVVANEQLSTVVVQANRCENRTRDLWQATGARDAAPRSRRALWKQDNVVALFDHTPESEIEVEFEARRELGDAARRRSCRRSPHAR